MEASRRIWLNIMRSSVANTAFYFSGRCLVERAADHELSETQDSTMAMACTHFLSLVGLELDYYGCDQADNTFKVDEIIFKVLEDPDDGYRSCLGTMDYTRIHRDRPTSIFYRKPIATVKIVPFDDDQMDMRGYRLIDISDNHCWLEFGTDHHDDYYPTFIFRHTPKDPN